MNKYPLISPILRCIYYTATKKNPVNFCHYTKEWINLQWTCIVVLVTTATTDWRAVTLV